MAQPPDRRPPAGARPQATPGACPQATPGACPQATPGAWLRARARLMPGAVERSAPWVRGVFEHPWAAMKALETQVRPLPEELWAWLLGCAGGYVAVQAGGESRYQVGPMVLRGREVHNVALVAVEDLAADNERPLHAVGNLIDHHLGCEGRADGPWLSDGGGVLPSWQQAGARLGRLFALGYAADEVARAGTRDYLAQSLALYCRERQRLNTADPQVCKWLRSTLWNQAFWQDDRAKASQEQG